MSSLASFNALAVESLVQCLSRVYTKNNLLLLDRSLSSLVNYLTPFLRLKEAGKFDKLIWIDEDLDPEVLDGFDGLILLVGQSSANIDYIKKLYATSRKLNIIVDSLTRSFLFKLSTALKGRTDFDFIAKSGNQVNLKAGVKVMKWETYPIYQSDILSVNLPRGGLEAYFRQPLELIHYLLDGLVAILRNSKSINGKYLKLENIFGKGNHSDLLIRIFQHERLPEFLSQELDGAEREFYQEKLRANTDLVVLDRNLDFASVAFNQLSYQGLIDDLFEIDLNETTVGNEKVLLDDDLYRELKHLNFASVGPSLNQAAKIIQHEFQQNDNTNDLKEMKKLVDNLGSLTTKQELIKKHTRLSESILNTIKFSNIDGVESIDTQYEEFLLFENEFFDRDYRTNLATLKEFLNQAYDSPLILSTIFLISIVNDGIRERDFHWILDECMQNYGLKFALGLKEYIKLELIRITQDGDFFSSLTAMRATEEAGDDLDILGITGAQDTYKSNYTLIDKFWNLHPPEEVVVSPTGLMSKYSTPSFALPGNTVPLLYRLVEALYFRDFLTYKPVNNTSRRPNWDKLGVDTMFKGKTVDINLGTSDDHEKYLVVVVLGGITRSEISCLQYLQERFDRTNHKKIIVLSSGIINSKDLYNLLYI